MDTETQPKPSLNEGIAEEIRALLARRRLSASDLARMTGLTQRAISRRLTGEKVIDADDLERIAAVLNVEVTDLLPREGKLIAVGGTTRTPGRESKPWKNLARPTRPHPVGPPSRTAPSALRTGRVNPALVAA